MTSSSGGRTAELLELALDARDTASCASGLRLRAAAALALVTLLCVALPAPADFNFDVNGDTLPGGAITADLFEWFPDNLLMDAAVPMPAAPATIPFTFRAQGRLGAFGGGSGGTLDPGAEITFVLEVPSFATIVASGGGLDIALHGSPAGGGTLSIYYDDSAGLGTTGGSMADDRTGAGYDDGRLIATASISAQTTAEFGTVILNNLVDAGLLDHFGVDNQGGVTTIPVSGNITHALEWTFMDGTFFLDAAAPGGLDNMKVPLGPDANWTTGTVTPFLNANPSDLVAGATPDYGDGINDNLCGAGPAPCDLHLETDARQPFFGGLAALVAGVTASPDTVVEPGENVTYTFSVYNGSTSAVTINSLVDTVYGDLNGQGTCTVPQVLPAAATYNCSLVAFVAGSGGETHSDTFTASGVDAMAAPVSAEGSATVTITAETDLSIVKSDNGSDAVAGSSYVYTLKVTNNGPSASTGATVSDTLPAGWTFVSGTGCAGTATGFDCTVGALAAGGMQSFTVTVAVPAGHAPGMVTNTAAVTANEPDPAPGNGSDNESTNVISLADLSIDKTDEGSNAVAGTSYIYTLKVTNNGPSDSTGATVSDTLPAGWTFVSGTGCAGTAGGFDCTVGALAAGGMQSFTVTVAVPAGHAPGMVTNTAAVTGNEDDPVPGNDSDDESTNVISQADLSISKSDDPDPVLAGTGLIYTVMVSNAGPSDALAVSVADTLPAGMTAQSTTGCVNDPDGVPTCELGALAAGASRSYTIDVLVDAGTPDGTVTNTAEAVAGGGTLDPDPRNNSVNEDTTITRLLAAAQPGSVLVYPLFDVNDGSGSRDAKSSTLKLSNLGPADVSVHLVRVCGAVKSFGGRGLCQASDRTLTLTPGETAVRDVASFFSIHRALCPSGYIVAFAQNANGVPVVWDHLLGSMHFNGAGALNQRTAGLQAIALQAAGGQPQGAPVQGAAGGLTPVLPFDGLGYRLLPARLHTDVLATAGSRHTELVLLTLDVQAAAQNPPTLVALDWWNQHEEPFSGALEYVCHVYVRLDDESNPEQPGAGVQGGGALRAPALGSSYGLLQVVPLGRDAVLGAVVEVGQNRLTLRHLLHPGGGAKATTFIGR